jgi:neutral trehalase
VEEANELMKRADYYRNNLKSMWDEEFGMFLNKHTDTGKISKMISPTNFYAILGKYATQEQA